MRRSPRNRWPAGWAVSGEYLPRDDANRALRECRAELELAKSRAESQEFRAQQAESERDTARADWQFVIDESAKNRDDALQSARDLAALQAKVALAVAPRWDLGTDIYKVSIRSTLRGNAAGDDARYLSDGQEVFIIPQGGFVARYGDRIGYGATLFAAGLGTDYPDNPYQRFGGSPRGGVKLGQSILSSALAYALTPRHTIGVGINQPSWALRWLAQKVPPLPPSRAMVRTCARCLSRLFTNA